MSRNAMDFLEAWMAANVPVQPHTVEAGKLGERLRRDAAAAGFLLQDMELDKSSVEKFILDAMLHQAEPGVPGD